MAQKITHFSVGDLWQPQFTFTSGGSNVDPTTITVVQQDPAGVETTVASSATVSALTSISTPVAKMSIGVFKLNPGVNLNTSGYWFVKAIGQGAAQAAIQEQVIVDPDEFTSDAGVSPRALVSLSETKDWLQQQNIDLSEDMEIVRVINDVSQRMHDEAEREFKPITAGTSTRTFEVEEYGSCVRVGDMNVLSTASNAISIIGSDRVTVIKTLSSTDVTTYPLVRQAWEPIRKILINPTSYRYLVPGQLVTVSASWGFPAVPGNLRQAMLDAIAYVLDRDVEHYHQDLGAVSGGDVTLMLALPPAALEIASWYSDQWIG